MPSAAHRHSCERHCPRAFRWPEFLVPVKKKDLRLNKLQSARESLDMRYTDAFNELAGAACSVKLEYGKVYDACSWGHQGGMLEPARQQGRKQNDASRTRTCALREEQISNLSP